jgi:hypothetical protein
VGQSCSVIVVIVVVVVDVDAVEGVGHFAVAFASSQHLLQLKGSDLGNGSLFKNVTEKHKN